MMESEGHFWASLGVGFHDFAGSTVVHTIGGFVALAGSIVLGPRLGRRFKRDGGGPMLPHDLTIAACGGLLLWFGWYGFNPGSTLSAMDFQGIGRVAANTTLAACAAGLTAMLYAYTFSRKWDVSFTVNGFLAGLVAITCPCYWVSPTGAILLGGVAGVIVVAGVEALEWLRIDDPIGAVPVHGICGIWGTLSLGLFATGQYGFTGPVSPDNSAVLKGLFYGGTRHPHSWSRWPLCTPSMLRALCACRRRANSTALTCMNTAFPRIPSTSFRPLLTRQGLRPWRTRLRTRTPFRPAIQCRKPR
jgi:ammonium transporter, Amt family